jgi:hypothetical protein
MGFLERIKGLLAGGAARGREVLSRAAEPLRARRGTALIFLGAVLLILVCLIAILLLMNHNPRGRAEEGTDLGETFRPSAVPPEELFLPDEPDFLPGTRPERERRESWTAEDARPFWTELPQEDSGVFSDIIESVIDDLMERLP